MNNKPKVALFDFCETIANFQTADAYVDYIRDCSKSRRMILWDLLRRFAIYTKIINVIDILTRRKYPLYKLSKLYQLKGFSYTKLNLYAERYYNEVIKPNLIPSVMNILQSKQKENYKIIIVSGGYDIYLSYFAKEYSIDMLLSSKIEFSHGIATGFLNGKDCMNENKVYLLDAIFDKSLLYSESYSDSITDLPLLKWSDKGFVVSYRYPQKWVKNNNLGEIIWE